MSVERGEGAGRRLKVKQSVMDANVEVKQSKMDAVAKPITAGNSWDTKRKNASRARKRGNKV